MELGPSLQREQLSLVGPSTRIDSRAAHKLRTITRVSPSGPVRRIVDCSKAPSSIYFTTIQPPPRISRRSDPGSSTRPGSSADGGQVPLLPPGACGGRSPAYDSIDTIRVRRSVHGTKKESSARKKAGIPAWSGLRLRNRLDVSAHGSPPRT